MSPNVAYVRERYQWLKAHGVCVSCGQADAEPDRVRCKKCLDVRARLTGKWHAEHPEETREYARKWNAEHPGYRRELYKGAGRLTDAKKPRIRKPDGTCRRRGCCEAALPVSCWCQIHLDEMRERRRTRESLVRLNECASMARCSLPPGV